MALMNCRLSRKCQKESNQPELERGIMGSFYYRCPQCRKSSRTANSTAGAEYFWNVFQRTAQNLVKPALAAVGKE